MAQKFIENGYDVVETEEMADVYIINTCTVTNMADRKSRQMLRRVKQINPNSIVVATGCYAQVAKDELQKIYGQISPFEFKDKLIFYKERKMYKDLKGEDAVYYSFNRENDEYLKGMEYEVQMILGTYCNCFIGGRTSGNVAAMVFNPYYDYTYFWNLGRYGIDDTEYNSI